MMVPVLRENNSDTNPAIFELLREIKLLHNMINDKNSN